MKSAAFDYVKPKTIDETISLLTQYGDDARVLAGGQTLIATLNMRLSNPALVIDINGLDDLRGIRVHGDTLIIGALTSHSDIEHHPLIKQHAPLLHHAAPHIAHRAIRNKGTWGGSIAYADPAAEWPTCLLALNGVVVAHGPRGERKIPVDDFFTGLYETALEPDEILTSCEIPIADSNSWFAFDELSRRHGDYAIVGMAISAKVDRALIQSIRIAFLGIDTTPVRAKRTEALVVNQTVNASLIEQAVESVKSELDPLSDLTNSPATKRHLASVLLKRALLTLSTH